MMQIEAAAFLPWCPCAVVAGLPVRDGSRTAGAHITTGG